MQPPNDRRLWNVRALFDSTAMPFTIADYAPRAAIFRQGDPCDSVMHIESGRVWLAVAARNGKLAICGLLGTGRSWVRRRSAVAASVIRARSP